MTLDASHWPMLSTIITVVTASLVGSLHCAAMCGGLVSFTCGSSERPRLAQLTYHGGRFVMYTALGASAGYLGMSLNDTINVAGIQNLASIIAGGTMIGWAIWTVLKRRSAPSTERGATSPGTTTLSLQKPKPSRLSSWFAWLHRLPSSTRGALLGITSAVLPCGWLYTFVAAAAGQGTPAAGAAVMAAFWLGTIPMLVGVGSIVSLLGIKARRWLPHSSAAVLLVLGLSTLILRKPITSFEPSTPDSDTTSHPNCH